MTKVNGTKYTYLLLLKQQHGHLGHLLCLTEVFLVTFPRNLLSMLILE